MPTPLTKTIKVAGSLLLGAAVFYSATAAAEGDKVDEAHQHITEAIQGLRDATPDEATGTAADHQRKAILLLTRAQSEVLQAKQVKE